MKRFTEEKCIQLRDDYVFWRNIARGFVEDESGDKTIHLNGRDMVGYWVYGYPIPANENDMYIYGGKTIDDINNPKNKYLVVFDSLTRCTGYLTPTKTGHKPIFQYDVVTLKTKFKTTFNLTVYWDAVECAWHLTNFDDQYQTHQPMTARNEYIVTGTTFDKK
jgi:hypothetical protein